MRNAGTRAIAIGAVLVCCSGGVGPAVAGRVTGHRTDSENRLAAIRDGARLLRRVRLPTGASPSSNEPANDGGVLAGPALTIGVENLVDLHAWWTVPEPMDEVFQYERHHPPSGGRVDITCGPGGNQQPARTCVASSFNERPGILGVRELVVEMVDRGDGTTGVRVDAEVQWIILRPASEVIPEGVRAIRITRPPPGRPISRTVTQPQTVRKIIHLFDALPIAQPAGWHCPHETGPAVSFAFRRRPRGRDLATAWVLAEVGPSQTSCDGMSFWIGRRPQHPLVNARDFLRSVGHLLGIQLTQPRPR